MCSTVVNQNGDYSVYIGNVNGDVNLNISGVGVPNYRQIFHDISTDLRSWRTVLYQQRHIPRQQTEELLKWVDVEQEKEDARVALLVGAPGSGKSVVMHDLLDALEVRQDAYVLGLKSDQISIESMESLARQNGISHRMEGVVSSLAEEDGINRVVLLVDQIDALSLTLSSNRKPLRSILSFIENIKSIDKVRIIVSCRPYDLEYDPFLEQFQYDKRVTMEPLRPEVVDEALKVNSRPRIPQGTTLFNTLRTPLYLYLFLKLKGFDSWSVDVTLTEHGLYNLLWKQTIVESESVSSRIDYQRLLQLLDQITGKMYENQSLTLSRISTDSAYAHELEYLLHEEFLINVSADRIQFFHQSLFDYIYARRFVERRDDLLVTIGQKHQGLFIRALVKSVLSFMRDSSFDEYLRVIQRILFDKTDDGRDVYRFHLKALVLSMMGYSKNLRQEEVTFVRDVLSKSEQYTKLFIKGIRSDEWFAEIQKIIDHSGGWEAMPEEKCLLMVGICSRIIFFEQYQVLDYLNSYVTHDIRPSARRVVVDILESFKPDADNLPLVESLYDKLILEDNDASLANLLNNVTDLAPEFVIKRLRRMVSSVIGSSKKNGRDITLSHEIEHIYGNLYEQFPEMSYQEFISIVKEICEKTKAKYGDRLYESTAYMMFQPISNPTFGYKFPEDVLSIVILETDNRAKEGREGIVGLVKDFNESKFDTIRIIAACAYLANPSLFKEQIFTVFTDAWLLSNCSSLLKYYYRMLLGPAFGLFSQDEQQQILDTIMKTARISEASHTIKEHQEWGVGISLIGELKYEYLSEVPDDILKTHFKSAYKEKQECMRRFGKRENKRPYRMQTMAGWTGLGIDSDRVKKITPSQWLKVMRKYTRNVAVSFDKPTLYGSAKQFEEAVANNPQKMLATIETAMDDVLIPSEYVFAGIKGLITAKYDFATIEDVYLRMVAKLKPAINDNLPSDLITLVRQAEYFIKSGNSLRKEILDLLTTVVRDYNDKRGERDEDETEKDPFQSGINEVRGSACEYLLECYRFPEYEEDIFSAFETLPGNSTIHTRSALIFKMALLNHLDTERSLDLYLKLMDDAPANLLAMPLHNLNPLLYYINYGFPRLIPLFEKAIHVPMCHEQMSILLWLAYAKRKDGAEDLLSKMLSASDKAKAALVEYFCRSYDQSVSPELIIPWVRFCLLSQQTETDLAKTYDDIFDELIRTWPPQVQEEMLTLFIDGGWVVNGHRDFVKYLGSMAISAPSNCLEWLKKTLASAPNLMQDSYASSRIFEILIQAYNGLSEFGIKTPDLEFAMDLLDNILSKQEHQARMDMFLYTLDNA